MGSVFSGVGQAIGSIGGLTNGVAQGFTPQNGYQAANPLNVGALNGQISTAQGNLGTVNGQQQQLAQALLAQSQGQGANPAQAMLNQATNQNIQQNAGFLASQKGISPALAATQAAQNQGAMSQQAAAQGAVMNAQQQVSAQQNLGNLYGQMANQNLQNINQSGQLINQDINGTNQINAGVSAQNAAANQNTAGGLMGGMGGGIAKMLSHGGTVEKFAGGGQVGASQSIANSILQSAGVPMWQSGNAQSATQGGGVQGGVQSLMSGMGGDGGLATGSPIAMAGGPMDAGAAAGGAGGAADLAVLAAAHGGTIPKHLHPIAKLYHPNFQAKGTDQLKAAGGKVPGKAKVPGDSPKNDTVKTMLSPGEIVIPRSVVNSKNPEKAAADFVAQELQKRGAKGGGSGDPHKDFQSALKEAIMTRKSA